MHLYHDYVLKKTWFSDTLLKMFQDISLMKHTFVNINLMTKIGFSEFISDLISFHDQL